MKKVSIIFFSLFLLLCAAVGWAKHHPGIDWREIVEGKFVVIFPVGYEEEAGETLVMAGEIYGKLKALWGNEVKGKIRIVLSDRWDDGNGSATFFPFHHIEIFLYHPPPDSSLGSCRDWVKLVLTHELNHIFNQDAGSGFTYFMRGLFGSNPVFYPMIYAPGWLLEGAAVYAESQFDAGGRLNMPDFQLGLDNFAAGGHLLEAGDIYGYPTTYPGPEAEYLYGGLFLQYLVDTYGMDSVRRLMHNFGYHFIPQVVSSRFKKIFGKSLKVLWKEFTGDIHLPVNEKPGNMEVLTTDGWYKQYPVVTAEDKIYYFDKNPKQFPGIFELDRATGKRRRLCKKDGVNAIFYSPGENKIYFSAGRYYRSFYRYSDIFVYDLGKDKLKRLTRGQRLAYPVVVDDVIYCVKRQGTSSYLAVIPGTVDRSNKLSSNKSFDQTFSKVWPPAGAGTGAYPPAGGTKSKVKILSKSFTALAQLAVSPDGRYLAAAVKEKGKEWNIALFSRQGELLQILTGEDGGTKKYLPTWKDNKTLYYISATGTGPGEKPTYQLCSIHIEDGTVYRYMDKQLPAVKYFSLLPGSDRLVLSFFDSNGFNLGLYQVQDSLFQEQAGRDNGEQQEEATAISQVSKQKLPGTPRRYRFLRELLPKYFSINLREAGEEVQPGIYITGTDALEKNNYLFELFYGFDSNTWNININYTYDGLYPTLIFRYSDLTDMLNRGGNFEYFERSREVEFAALFPLAFSEKRQTYWYTGVYHERIDYLDERPGMDWNFNLGGVKLALLHRSAQRYYDAITYADGARCAVSFAADLPFLGSDYEIYTAAIDYRQYITLFRPNVVAFRLAVADSWGPTRRYFTMGGVSPLDALQLSTGDLFDLMRGFSSGFSGGTGGYLINLEYRIALFKIERVFTFIQSLDRVYLTLFADIGNTWRDEKIIQPQYSFGVELNLIGTLAGDRFDLVLGGAIGRNPNLDPVIYFRVGRSF